MELDLSALVTKIDSKKREKMMDDNNIARLKSVFPLFYWIIFAYTVFMMFWNYCISDPPPMISAVNGEGNILVLVSIFKIYAFILCFYVVVYYARLEMLDNEASLSIPNKKWVFIVEFLLRLLLVSVVAFKVISYSGLHELFFFSSLLCGALSGWLIFMKKFNIINIQALEITLSLLILFFSLAAFFASSSERQIDFALGIMGISLTCSFVLAAAVFYMASRIWKNILDAVRYYILEW